jgi:hypothetical protein
MTRLQAAQQKRAEYFYAIIGKANKLYRSGITPTSLLVLDTEWENIALVFDFLQSRLRDGCYTAVLCNNYASDAGFYLSLHRQPMEHLSWLHTAIEAARIIEEPNIESNHLGNEGNCHYLLGNIEQVM